MLQAAVPPAKTARAQMTCPDPLTLCITGLMSLTALLYAWCSMVGKPLHAIAQGTVGGSSACNRAKWLGSLMLAAQTCCFRFFPHTLQAECDVCVLLAR